ncbi:MAG TPA: hypothetical protein VLE95_01075 [Chlamydiales bacterium]|nr:hypothetical protein [Chlamydiales bacterium]
MNTQSILNFCQSFSSQIGIEPSYCPSLETMDKIAEWICEAIRPVVTLAKWGWKASGEHYGPSGQALYCLLVGAIGYNGYYRLYPKREVIALDCCRKNRHPSPSCHP